MKKISQWIAIIFLGASQPFLHLFIATSALRVTPQRQDHTVGTLPVRLASWERVDRMKDKMEVEKDKGSIKEDIYDFIVVGAGTSGSIVAARLSEHFSVLLLEAGGQPHPNHENPATSMIMARHPHTDWMYPTVCINDAISETERENFVIQNDNCTGRRYILSSGKGCGGSGILNFLERLYEGQFPDYGEWMDTTKDLSWGFYQLQPYFRRVKEYMTKVYPDPSPIYRSTFKALSKLIGKVKIQKYSHVNKIIVGDNARALGVQYERHGHVGHAFATREVIISAGTFGSPKILLLSGIGPKEDLQSLNIPTYADLPSVGKNLQDHLAIPLGPFFKSMAPKARFSTPEMEAAWNSTRILRLPLINFNVNTYSKEMSHFLGIPEEVLKKYMTLSQKRRSGGSSTMKDNIGGGDTMFINVALKKPMSRGTVTLAGSDPKLYPVINPNYLNGRHNTDLVSAVTDKQLLIEALEETVRLLENGTSVKAKFTSVRLPGCENHRFRGFGYWDCYIRHFSMSFNHAVGTCSMGEPSAMAVVDPELRVVGIQGLRVIDASVMPTLVGTFPFESVAVIAEKGADMILAQYKAFQKPIQPLELHEDTKQDAQQIPGFRIKKLSVPIISSGSGKGNLFSTTKQWQKADQIVQAAVSHHVGSSLSEDDLLPPGESPQKSPNPSYYSVMPLAARLIFHPVIPQQEEKGDSDGVDGDSGVRRL